MNEGPRIAVLLATYNGQQWIGEQLDSVFSQTDCNVDVFVNDDGSADQTLEAIAAHPAAARIAVSKRKCGGAGQNFLFILSHTDLSSYDFVAFCDQDDIWEHNKLQRAVAVLQESGADGYSSDVTAFWPDGERRPVIKSQRQRDFDHCFESAGPGCTFVLARKTVRELKEFLSSCAADDLGKISLHDWFIYCWARETGRQWVIDSFSSLNYRQHGSNVLGAARGLAAWKARWAMVNDGWYLSQARLNAELTGANNPPVRFLRERGFKDFLFCLRNFTQMRRRKSEAAFLSLIFLFHFLRLA